MTEQAQQRADAADFMELFREGLARQLDLPGATKRSAVRLALTDLIRQGHLRANDVLPGELALAEGLEVSLGTVQAALGQLQDVGFLRRRRGDGTRVTENAVSGEFNPSVWHFRFRELATGQPFRAVEQEIEVLETDKNGPWGDHLGEQARYTLIRRMRMGEGEAKLGAEMYLLASKVPVALLPLADLRATNIRHVIERILKVETRRVEHVVHVQVLPRRLAALFSLPLDEPVMVLEARTYLDDDEPFYYQRIFAPTDRFALEF